ncbi:MAG TPA: threonine synthase [Vicinamibacteria bacterium]
MSHVTGLQCRACGHTWGKEPVAACAECWGPLEPVYDLEHARRHLTREAVAARPRDLWRYRELLPLDGEPTVGHGTGFTPLVPAPRLGERLRIRDLWIKYDAACHPTLSFKDRLVAVALSKAREFGMDTVGCASTGNLANAVAAAAARAGLRAVVLVPVDLEAAKLAGTAVFGATLVGVRGNYDRVNRLCVEIADRFAWGIVNVNLRAYYGEGSKTVGFEVAEQLGWSLPGHVVCPMAGASLITKVERAFRQLAQLGLVDETPFALHGAQPAGCAPVARAWKEGLARPRLVKPDTIVRSLAIGDPADGEAALAAIRRTGGRAEDPGDDEVVHGMRLLAETEGLFAETAGGTVVAAAGRMAEAGAFADGRRVVLLITGHGLKTVEALSGRSPFAAVIEPRYDDFAAFWEGAAAIPAAS